MKYRDLIEKLLPFADDEINLIVQTEDVPMDVNDLENWDRVNIDTVFFYRNEEDSNDLICSVEQRYNSESFDNIGEAKITTI
jgi:hypothetical protein